MRCIKITGSDNRMDCRVSFHDPINALPTKCDQCRFPDLNFVPQPYYLIKSRTFSSNEMALAENGNFLVRDRIKRVLEIVTPKDLKFYPTYFQNTIDLTPWSLAVPYHQVETAAVKQSIKRCPSCNEPHSAHPGTQFSKWLWDFDSEHHIVKSATWGSSESGWNQWISVASFMTLRLFSLLKQIKAKGLQEATCGATTNPSSEEKKWIKEQYDRIESEQQLLNPTGTVAAEDAKWFRTYLKENQSSITQKVDWKPIEKKLKIKFPKSYKDYIEKVGKPFFQDPDAAAGDSIQILLPDELCSSEFTIPHTLNQNEDQDIHYIPFAITTHGDSYCFNIRKEHKEFEVSVYLHESNHMEAYTENFATFIKRLSNSN